MTTETDDYPNSTTHKTDLFDLTFLMPLRIDSIERKENADTVIKYIFRHFNTSFIVLEADKEQKYFADFSFNGFKYVFIEDRNEVFRKTIWINRLISMSTTKFLGIWDADAVAPPEQIINSYEKLKNEEAVMSLPFDGRFYATDKVSFTLFKTFLEIEILLKKIKVMYLMHGYHSPGGAFMVNKEKYIQAGGENEKFYGWGPEDFEHIKRMEVLNLNIHYSKGPLFHLWHPVGKNSKYASNDAKLHNQRVFLETCKRSNFK